MIPDNAALLSYGMPIVSTEYTQAQGISTDKYNFQNNTSTQKDRRLSQIIQTSSQVIIFVYISSTYIIYHITLTRISIFIKPPLQSQSYYFLFICHYQLIQQFIYIHIIYFISLLFHTYCNSSSSQVIYSHIKI